MNLDVLLPQALAHLVPRDAGKPRVFPDVAPMDTATPYITFAYVGGQPVSTLAGNNPINVRLQFNVWSKTRLEANEVIRGIGEVLTQPPFRAVSQGEPAAEYEPVTKERGARQDFSIWLQEVQNT